MNEFDALYADGNSVVFGAELTPSITGKITDTVRELRDTLGRNVTPLIEEHRFTTLLGRSLGVKRVINVAKNSASVRSVMINAAKNLPELCETNGSVVAYFGLPPVNSPWLPFSSPIDGGPVLASSALARKAVCRLNDLDDESVDRMYGLMETLESTYDLRCYYADVLKLVSYVKSFKNLTPIFHYATILPKSFSIASMQQKLVANEKKSLILANCTLENFEVANEMSRMDVAGDPVAMRIKAVVDGHLMDPNSSAIYLGLLDDRANVTTSYHFTKQGHAFYANVLENHIRRGM